MFSEYLLSDWGEGKGGGGSGGSGCGCFLFLAGIILVGATGAYGFGGFMVGLVICIFVLKGFLEG